MENKASQHDSYAADYDSQVQAYDCHLADVLFGLCYAFIQPGQHMLDAGIGSGLMFIPFAFPAGILMRWRSRLLPYLAIIHALMDMTFAAMLLGVAY